MSEHRVTLPRLGGHLSVWGSGHSCSAEGPHDVCVCDCGVPAPWDNIHNTMTVPAPTGWTASP